ncbi:MAG: response regulator [Hyphomicrobiales bacterium]|nr:MAG: response regulator [Hyphomicrobiales bacterium]
MFESCRAYVMAANLRDSLALETAAHHLGFGEVVCGLDSPAHAGHPGTTITYFFLDYRMRDEELVDTLAAIREERSSRLCYSPVILFTADQAAETVVRYVRFGFDDVISLPARRDELAERLADQLYGEQLYIETKDYFGPDRRRLDRGAELRLGISPHTRLVFERDPRRGVRVLDREVRGHRFKARPAPHTHFMAKLFGQHAV